ncbi:DMSO/selenate family reductase complex A subunit [Flaviflexus equikiangi]|uniref:Molybdopterin-dependent oxidoreductase n=1 Tax=Flaviflexus equikiangi TaxID=2758573 RepID=A0ABS2TCY5_9ACTO|nr:DMSO/selenate family reductase complex A subunit [Flaviflexus equikiangi]MBM9432514.1 molybdopterin-dependent oxidoreductase [Flaviflexus equikiangi]
MSETLSRRSFVKWSGVAGGSAALVATAAQLGMPQARSEAVDGVADAEATVWSACVVNCGSRCPLRLQVKDGTVVRVLPDNTGDDTLWNRQIRACVRGRNMRERIYNPDRIKKPLKRVGAKRSDGEFEEISWDEAIDLIAEKLQYTYDTYGPEAVYKQYGSGVWNAHVANSGGWARLLNLLGGHLNYYGNYSYLQISQCTRYFYGSPDEQISNSIEDAIENSKLLVLWGNNPLETRMSGGGNTYTATLAKKAGLKIIVVDPRYSDSASVLADDWIALRPGTDAALVAGMAHVMITENLHDQDFLDTYCVGFDEKHMPEGAPKNASYRSYVEGKGEDGIEKTPEWAADITGVPASKIRSFAREVATAKPANIAQGWGPQRHANGENSANAIYLLAALTGNVGIPGGGTGGREGYLWPYTPWIDDGVNPVTTAISCYKWTDAISRAEEMTATRDGVQGKDRLEVGIKFMVVYGSNMLASQHGDINRTREILDDDSMCEFIVGMDNQMNASMKMCDLVLPDTTTAERWDIVPSEYTGDMAYEIMIAQAIDPLYESRSSIEVTGAIAERMGIGDEFAEGKKTTEDWARWVQDTARENNPGMFPTFDELIEQGVFRYTSPDGPTVALKEFRDDPEANPLATPSGKIEIYSSTLAQMAKEWEFPNPLPGDELTPIPAYVETWEGQAEARTNEKYPLQCIGHHFKGRTHSTYGNLESLRDIHHQRVWINDADARKRGIVSDDRVTVSNDRGTISLPAMVTPRIVPGVISVPQGAWIEIDKDGVDHGGAVNMLTSLHPTPLAKGNGQHTNLVEVAKA